MMGGLQKTLAEGLREILDKVESGAYGKDDDINVEAVEEDIEDVMWDVKD